MVFRMFFYTSVFIICWTGPLAHRFAQYFQVNSTAFTYADAIGQRYALTRIHFDNQRLSFVHETVFRALPMHWYGSPIRPFSGRLRKISYCAFPAFVLTSGRKTPNFLFCEIWEFTNTFTTIGMAYLLPLVLLVTALRLQWPFHSQDMQKLDIIIRKNIITFLLYGMKEGVRKSAQRALTTVYLTL